MDMKKPQYGLAALIALSLVFFCAGYLVWRQGGPDVEPRADSADSVAEASPESNVDNVDLLSRVIMGEAADEPYLGKVAVGAVIMNRCAVVPFPTACPVWDRSPGPLSLLKRTYLVPQPQKTGPCCSRGVEWV